MSIQFKKRSGSTIREYNINAVIEMLKKGMSEGDIMTLLAMSFCPDTRADYLNTAKEKLKMENFTTTSVLSSNNTTNTCKNCGNSTPDNTTFCSENCKELYKHRNEKENSTDCKEESLIEYAKKHPHGETHQ